MGPLDSGWHPVLMGDDSSAVWPVIGTALRKRKPVPFSSLLSVLYAALALYAVALVRALIDGDWAHFAAWEQGVGLIGAVFLMAYASGKDVRLGTIAAATGLAGMFGVAGAVVAVNDRVEGELSFHDALVFPGAGIVYGLVMLTVFVAVTHLGSRRE